MAEKCPGCGSGFRDRPYRRKGWEYAECGRRWHPEHGWETYIPWGCYRNQNAQLREKLAAADAVMKDLRAKLKQAALRIERHRSNSFNRAFDRKP